MTNRILPQIALVTGTLLFSLGIQTYAQTWSAPTASPPNSNAYAPLNTSPAAQIKTGGLLLNTGGAINGLIVQNGNVGIGTTSPTAKLDVQGYVKGTGLCIGNDCRTSWAAPRYTTRNSATVQNRSVSVACQINEAMTGGGCNCQDTASGGDSSAYGGYPSGNGWTCPNTTASGCGRNTAYVRCVSY